MSAGHNHVVHVAPIHRLPFETLVHIFILVSINRCHKVDFVDGHPPGNPPQYPDCLAHVCSRWRQIALSSPYLWTHVDLDPRLSSREGLVNRTYNYTQRASMLPLDVHIDDKGCVEENSYILEAAFSHVASRTRSLNFIITAPELLHFHRSVFDSMVPILSPKLFNTLYMSCDVSLPDPFFAGRNSDPWITHNSDDLDECPNILRWESIAIDGSLSGVSNLHLQGVYFNWSSQLYHGLVDLRLTSPPVGKAADIDVYALRSILSNCPGLRIFHFSLELVTYDDPGYEYLYKDSSDPVCLPDLEVIYVSTARAYYGKYPSFNAGALLRLLAPGSKPLRLTIETGHDRNEPLFNSDGMREFCARSRVERLCVRNAYPSLDELRLCHLPDLKVLVFDSCRNISTQADPKSTFTLDSCFIHAAKLDLNQLPSLLGLCPTGLMFSMCDIRDEPMGQESGRVIPEAELRAAFPTVQFLKDENLWHDPTASWDIVD
ncbi:hypothetical protein ACGC1H_000301 [Rhizoctonia solani]